MTMNAMIRALHFISCQANNELVYIKTIGTSNANCKYNITSLMSCTYIHMEYIAH